MKRKYLQDLINWNSDPNRKPLLVTGARQVGKSYLIKDLFAEAYYRNKYLMIDCSDDSEFVDYVYRTNNLEKLLDYLRIKYDFILDGSHLLVIDEAQECLPVIRMMKQFCEKYRNIPLIVSGSLVKISIRRQDKDKKNKNIGFLVPVGKINQLSIYSMTFSEFLENYNPKAYEYLWNCFHNKKPVDDGIHSLLIEYFHHYLFVGGLPEAVQTFILNKDNLASAYKVAAKVLKDIYSNYLNDMEFYQASTDTMIRTRAIYRNIYSQLNKENKNFKYSAIEKNMRNREALQPLEWLILADIVMKCDLQKEKVTSPLMESEETLFRLYLSDMGLFSYQSGLDAKTFFLSKDNVLSGIYFENYIATELHSHDKKLYYWKGKRNSEFEFLLDIDGHIIPLDSKKSKGRLHSLDEFRSHNKKDIVIKVSMNHYGYDKENQIVTLPYYFLSVFLDNLNESDEFFSKLIEDK